MEEKVHSHESCMAYLDASMHLAVKVSNGKVEGDAAEVYTEIGKLLFSEYKRFRKKSNLE